jgi:dynactin complex subunit
LELGQSVIVGRSDPAPGTVRYVGAVAFAEGEWVGIEMETRGVGRHDGRVGGVRYFQCAGGRGVFVASARLTPA